MGYERQYFLNAQPYERSQQRVDQANGFYRRGLTTRLGALELKVPRTRSGHFQTQVLARYQRREPMINEALKQVFLLGVSTRQAGRALATLVEDAVSAATVSAEGQDSWFDFLWGLFNRGLHGQFLELIATDGQAGLAKAIHRLWPAVLHQRCRAHKLRNLENKLKASQKPCLEEAKLIYQASNRTEAIARFKLWRRHWQKSAPNAVNCLEKDLEELLAFFRLP